MLYLQLTAHIFQMGNKYGVFPSLIYVYTAITLKTAKTFHQIPVIFKGLRSKKPTWNDKSPTAKATLFTRTVIKQGS